jgi:hypothetical protein
VSVSTDGLESWNDAVRRATNGEVVAVIAHGQHVADGVPSGELERLRETIEVLSDRDAISALVDTETAVVGHEAVRQLVASTRPASCRTDGFFTSSTRPRTAPVGAPTRRSSGSD